MTRTKKSAALLKILVIAAILILLPIVTPNMYIMQIINMIGMDMHHIVSSKCTIKCCEKGRAYRRKSP